MSYFFKKVIERWNHLPAPGSVCGGYASKCIHHILIQVLAGGSKSLKNQLQKFEKRGWVLWILVNL